MKQIMSVITKAWGWLDKIPRILLIVGILLAWFVPGTFSNIPLMSIVITVDNIPAGPNDDNSSGGPTQSATYTFKCTHPSGGGVCPAIRYDFHFPAQEPPPVVAMYKNGKPTIEATRVPDRRDRLGRPLWRFTLDEPIKAGSSVTLIGPINGFVDQDDLSLLNERRDELIGKRLACEKVPDKKGLLICDERPTFQERVAAYLTR